MSGRRCVVFLWLGVLLFGTHLASGQQNFGIVQGRLAQKTKQIEVLGRIGRVTAAEPGFKLVVPVSINGSKSSWWVVDTGAPACMIDPALANKLSLQTVGQVHGEGGTFPVATVNSLQIGNFGCNGMPCVAEPLGELKRLSVRGEGGALEQTGLIGINLLARYGALINCRTEQIFFSPSGNLGTSQQKYEAMGFTYVPLNIIGRTRLEVIGSLGGHEFSFFLDTGSFTTVVTNGIRAEVNAAFRTSRTKAVGAFHDFGKNSQLSYAEPSDFKLGNYDAKGAQIAFTTLNLPDNQGASHPLAGLIGLDFLVDRSAIIDIGGRALYLKPH
jgi:hypothetical protein